MLSYLVPSPPNSWKTAIPLENWRRKVSSASRPGVSASKLLTFDFVLCRLLNVAKPRVKFVRVESIQRGNPWNVCREPANLACYLRPRCCSLHMKEKKEWKRKGLNSIGRKGRDKSEKKIMYRLAGRGGFYVAVAVDDLRFLRVTHSLPLHDRNVWKKKKKKKKKQRAALRAVKKLFTATYIIWYERDRKCRAFTESSRIYIPSFRPRNVKWFVMKSSVAINPASVKNFTFFFFLFSRIR